MHRRRGVVMAPAPLVTLAQRGLIEVAERQLRATRGKFTGERRANAACGTCEDNRFALKIQSGLPSFWHPPPPWVLWSIAAIVDVMGLRLCALKLAFCAPGVNVKLYNTHRRDGCACGLREERYATSCAICGGCGFGWKPAPGL